MFDDVLYYLNLEIEAYIKSIFRQMNIVRMIRIILLYLIQIQSIIASHTKTNNNDLQVCLSESLPSIVRTVYPCSNLANVMNVRYSCQHFNISTISSVRGNRISHSPAVIVYVMSSSDVQNVMKCAIKLNYIVNALSGGHSYEGYGIGSTDNNIVINMGAINHIYINQNDGTGIFGSGARLGPIYYRTYQYGNYTINGGSCAWVGLGGLALGGGIGFLSRQHGLLSDKILEMKAVTAQGNLLTINETHETELYWALRGSGGGLFVIVIEFKLKLVPSPSDVTIFSFIWKHNTSKLVGQQFQSWIFNDPIVNSNNNIYWSMVVNDTSIQIGMTFFDIDSKELNKTMSLFLENYPTPVEIIVEKYDWLTFVNSRASTDATNAYDHYKLLLENATYPTFYFKAKHLFYNQPISNHSFDQLIDQISSRHGHIYVQFSPCDGYINTIPVDKTAFPHRIYKFGIQFMVYPQNEKNENEDIHWLNQVYLSVYEDSAKHSYINYIDRDQSNWMNAYYHMHQQRLIDIKRTYDKDNRFYFDRTIMTTSGAHKTYLNFYLATVLLIFFLLLKLLRRK